LYVPAGAAARQAVAGGSGDGGHGLAVQRLEGQGSVDVDAPEPRGAAVACAHGLHVGTVTDQYGVSAEEVRGVDAGLDVRLSRAARARATDGVIGHADNDGLSLHGRQ